MSKIVSGSFCNESEIILEIFYIDELRSLDKIENALKYLGNSLFDQRVNSPVTLKELAEKYRKNGWKI